MALSASGLFVPTFVNILSNTIAADLSSETNIKLDLMDNSTTPDFNTHDYLADLSSGVVTGTGWATPYTLTTTALTPTTGSLYYDADDVSRTSTTLSGVYGCLIWDDGVATPTADALIALVYFGASPYSTVNGTFAINWSTSPSAIFTIDMTP